jgi:hypothetical protein
MYFSKKKSCDFTQNKIIKRVNAIPNLSYFKNSLLLTLAKRMIPRRKMKLWVIILSTYKV